MCTLEVRLAPEPIKTTFLFFSATLIVIQSFFFGLSIFFNYFYVGHNNYSTYME